MRDTYAKNRPRFYDRSSFTAAESNRNGGISNCNVIRGESERCWRGGDEKRRSGWRAERRKKGERERGCRTKDKECETQGVTKISFDGITWRLRVSTVIALVVYK